MMRNKREYEKHMIWRVKFGTVMPQNFIPRCHTVLRTISSHNLTLGARHYLKEFNSTIVMRNKEIYHIGFNKNTEEY